MKYIEYFRDVWKSQRVWNEIDKNIIKLHIIYMEAYRSGRNELDSKSSCPQGHVGSNPTASVI